MYFLPKFFVDVPYDISYRVGYPWRPKQSIYKVKQVYPILPIFVYYNSSSFFQKIILRAPSR